jgi:hypothetical protein
MGHHLQVKEVTDEIKDSLRSKALQKMIHEGLAGTVRPGSLTRLRAIAAKARASARIHPHHKGLASKTDAEKGFSVQPQPPANVIPLSRMQAQ